MPVSTEITRNDERVVMHWNVWTLNRLADFMAEETGIPEEEVDFFPSKYVFERDHKACVLETNIFSDGVPGAKHVLEVKAGDTYKCWR